MVTTITIRGAAIVVAITCLLGAGCSRRSGGSPASEGALATPPPGTVASGASSEPAPDPQADAARASVSSWSRALDAHDVAVLDTLYAPAVCFYGHVLTKGDVMKAKRAALAGKSTFHQEIVGAVDVQRRADGAVVARFLKRSGAAGHLREVPAMLVMRPAPDAPGALYVVEEADANDSSSSSKLAACESDAWKKSQAAAVEDRCEQAVNLVVRTLPAVEAFYADATKAIEQASQGDGGDEGQTVIGGEGPEDDGKGLLTFSIGFHTAERFEPHVIYSVDQKTGEMTVSVDGADAQVPKSARKTVADACKQ